MELLVSQFPEKSFEEASSFPFHSWLEVPKASRAKHGEFHVHFLTKNALVFPSLFMFLSFLSIVFQVRSISTPFLSFHLMCVWLVRFLSISFPTLFAFLCVLFVF